MSKDLRNTLIAVAIFIALAGVMIYFVTETQDQLEVITKENNELEEQIKANKQYIERAPRLQAQLNELNANFRDYVKILPSAEIATTEKLYRTVQAYADAAQITVSELSERGAGGKKGGGKLGEFEEVSVNFRIDADFETFVRFINLLERHEQFMKVNAFQVTPASLVRLVDGKEIIDLAVTIEVSTYKYIPSKR
ncbi:MAG: type 4a pilus biogenesis protein PilO [Planctomycetota bacterium]